MFEHGNRRVDKIFRAFEKMRNQLNLAIDEIDVDVAKVNVEIETLTTHKNTLTASRNRAIKLVGEVNKIVD